MRKKYKKCQYCGKLYHSRARKYCNQGCRIKSYIFNISKEKLYDLYWKKKLSSIKIAKIFKVNYKTILRWMERYGIKRRTISEAEKNNPVRYWLGKKRENLHSEKHKKEMSKRMSGEKNPAFNNWISKEPYSPEFNEELKEKIRRRDNHECQYCHKKQKDFPKDKLNRKIKLAPHHTDYNKKNNNPLNLISLCPKCHAKTGFNRKHWKRYFQMQMFIKEFFNPENILIFNENKQLIGLEKI